MADRALVRRAVVNPWTEKITRAWHRTLEGFFECGRLLNRAKEDLKHGEYEAMVERDLPFGPRYALMLRKIAADPRLTNPNHASLLPPSPTTLYFLSRLDEVAFERAIAQGQIRADMRREQAGALVVKQQRLLRGRRAAEQNLGRGVSMWLVDPPWRPETWKPEYETLDYEDIILLGMGPDGRASSSLPGIWDLSAPCSACAIWAIDESLEAAGYCLEEWGFERLRPRLIWAKPTHGKAGPAALNQHEYLIIGVRGGATPAWRPPSVMTFPRPPGRQHSEKPPEVRDMLIRMFPDLTNRCELFARKRVDGWTGWGDQYPSSSALICAK